MATLDPNKKVFKIILEKTVYGPNNLPSITHTLKNVATGAKAVNEMKFTDVSVRDAIFDSQDAVVMLLRMGLF